MHSIWSWHPPVGVWIGVLGFLGVLVPLIRDLAKIGKGEKALWTFVVFALLLLEIKSVYQDRNEHDKQEAETREREEENFREIAGGIRGAIQESQRQFEATMRRTETLLNKTNSISVLTAQNLKNITGGDSFAYVAPQSFGGDEFPGIVWNNGEQPLTGLTLTIAHTSDPVPVWGAAFYEPIFIGTVGPHDHAPIPSFLFRPKASPTSGQDNYWIMLSAQNGTVSQGIGFRRDKRHPNVWAYTFQVTKQTFSGRPQQRRLEMKPSDIPKKRTYYATKLLLFRNWSDDLIEDKK